MPFDPADVKATLRLLVATFFAQKLHQSLDPQSETTERWDLIGGNIRFKNRA